MFHYKNTKALYVEKNLTDYHFNLYVLLIYYLFLHVVICCCRNDDVSIDFLDKTESNHTQIVFKCMNVKCL